MEKERVDIFCLPKLKQKHQTSMENVKVKMRFAAAFVLRMWTNNTLVSWKSMKFKSQRCSCRRRTFILKFPDFITRLVTYPGWLSLNINTIYWRCLTQRSTSTRSKNTLAADVSKEIFQKCVSSFWEHKVINYAVVTEECAERFGDEHSIRPTSVLWKRVQFF